MMIKNYNMRKGKYIKMLNFKHIILLSMIVLIFQIQAFEPYIHPRYDTISFPSSGFIKLDDEAVADSVNLKSWQIGESNGYNLYILPVMHRGSGRGWTITIGVGDSNTLTPDYGAHLSTSTIGWRTLQKFENDRLPWIEDIDGDSNDDIIIWDSFLAFESGTNGDFGLIAWVYSLDENGSLALNTNCTSILLDRVALEYKEELPIANVDTQSTIGKKYLQQNNSYHQMKRNSISQIIREYISEHLE
jgi:hypothetical protein